MRKIEYQDSAYGSFGWISFQQEFKDELTEARELNPRYTNRAKGLKKPLLKRMKLALPYLYLIQRDHPIQIHSRVLRAVFGKTDVGTRLAKCLLWVEDNSWRYDESSYTRTDEVFCKRYSVNRRNFKTIADEAGISKDDLEFAVIQDFIIRYKDQLYSGDFDFRNKGYRIYHELTTVQTDIRDQVFAHCGYTYEYDISACAPSIIIGLAKKNKIRTRRNELEQFAKNPKQWRKDLADKLNAPMTFVKRFVNAVIHGARLHPNEGTIHELCVEYDVNITTLAVATQNFRREFSAVLERLIKIGELVLPDDFDESIKLNKGQRVHYLFTRYEAMIRDVWTKFFKEHGFRVHSVHDGFYLSGDASALMNELSNLISEQIGFNVKIEGDVIEKKEYQMNEAVIELLKNIQSIREETKKFFQ